MSALKLYSRIHESVGAELLLLNGTLILCAAISLYYCLKRVAKHSELSEPIYGRTALLLSFVLGIIVLLEFTIGVGPVGGLCIFILGVVALVSLLGILQDFVCAMLVPRNQVASAYVVAMPEPTTPPAENEPLVKTASHQ